MELVLDHTLLRLHVHFHPRNVVEILCALILTSRFMFHAFLRLHILWYTYTFFFQFKSGICVFFYAFVTMSLRMIKKNAAKNDWRRTAGNNIGIFSKKFYTASTGLLKHHWNFCKKKSEVSNWKGHFWINVLTFRKQMHHLVSKHHINHLCIFF